MPSIFDPPEPLVRVLHAVESELHLARLATRADARMLRGLRRQRANVLREYGVASPAVIVAAAWPVCLSLFAPGTSIVLDMVAVFGTIALGLHSIAWIRLRRAVRARLERTWRAA